MPENQKPRSLLVRFFSNPLVGGLGTIITTLSLVAAIYFYLEQRQSRGLTYYVHPVKAAVVKAVQVSKLTALYDQKPVKTDITVAQVAVWNQGKLPVKDADILKTIVLFTADKSRILEATIRKVSRDVTKLRLQTDEAQNGQVAITWKIMEQNDGGIIQLIYAGNPDVDLRLDGVIEGQKEIERIVYTSKFKSPDEQYGGAGFSWFVLLMPLTIFFIFLIQNILAKRALITRIDLFAISVIAFLMVIYYFRSKLPGPPFAF